MDVRVGQVVVRISSLRAGEVNVVDPRRDRQRSLTGVQHHSRCAVRSRPECTPAQGRIGWWRPCIVVEKRGWWYLTGELETTPHSSLYAELLSRILRSTEFCDHD